MNVGTLRHVPWTCKWGRYGVAVEQVTPHESQVDDVFGVGGHHPGDRPTPESAQLMANAERAPGPSPPCAPGDTGGGLKEGRR